MTRLPSFMHLYCCCFNREIWPPPPLLFHLPRIRWGIQWSGFEATFLFCVCVCVCVCLCLLVFVCVFVWVYMYLSNDTNNIRMVKPEKCSLKKKIKLRVGLFYKIHDRPCGPPQIFSLGYKNSQNNFKIGLTLKLSLLRHVL